jgi:hypothetical protein
MSKLESYVDKNFNVARFYADAEGHNADWFLSVDDARKKLEV